MKKTHTVFEKIEVGSFFRARGKVWLKVEQRSDGLNAVEVSPDSVVVKIGTGRSFDNALLVKQVLGELPETTSNICSLEEARTP